MLTIWLLVCLNILSPLGATNSASLRDLVAFHNDVRHFRDKLGEDLPVVNVGDLWNGDKMMEVQGMETNDENVQELQRNEVEVPSLLTTLYNTMKDPPSNVVHRKCAIPGMKGNVVRSFRNHGRSLYQDRRRTVLELKFSLINAFHKYEDITDATLKISTPTLSNTSREAWNSLTRHGSALPRFKYEIYIGDGGQVENVRLAMSLVERDSGEMEVNWKPVITKYVSATFGNSGKEISLDVNSLVTSWKQKHFTAKSKLQPRAFLLVTTDASSSHFKLCLQSVTSPPTLIVTSHDRQQCPFASSSYEKVSNRIEIPAKNRVRRNAKNTDMTETDERISNETASPFKIPHFRNHKTRRVRNNPPISRSLRSTICKRHPMYLKFDEVGWEKWIIAPRGIQAYKCAGDCPYPLVGRMDGTNHALLMNLMGALETGERHSAKCVPSALSAMPLLYFDANGVVILRQYEDMIVQKCSCQ